MCRDSNGVDAWSVTATNINAASLSMCMDRLFGRDGTSGYLHPRGVAYNPSNGDCLFYHSKAFDYVTQTTGSGPYTCYTVQNTHHGSVVECDASYFELDMVGWCSRPASERPFTYNFYGHGAGTAESRWTNIGAYNGKTIDLVVRWVGPGNPAPFTTGNTGVTSCGYSATTSDTNVRYNQNNCGGTPVDGCENGIPCLFVQRGATVSFDMAFVETGTDTLVSMPGFYLTFYDTDGYSDDTRKEILQTVHNAAAMYTTAGGTYLSTTSTDVGGGLFDYSVMAADTSSSGFISDIDWSKGRANWASLTQEQLDAIVTFAFPDGTSSVFLDLQQGGDWDNGFAKEFYFGGASPLVLGCANAHHPPTPPPPKLPPPPSFPPPYCAGGCAATYTILDTGDQTPCNQHECGYEDITNSFACKSTVEYFIYDDETPEDPGVNLFLNKSWINGTSNCFKRKSRPLRARNVTSFNLSTRLSKFVRRRIRIDQCVQFSHAGTRHSGDAVIIFNHLGTPDDVGDYNQRICQFTGGCCGDGICTHEENYESCHSDCNAPSPLPPPPPPPSPSPSPSPSPPPPVVWAPPYTLIGTGYCVDENDARRFTQVTVNNAPTVASCASAAATSDAIGFQTYPGGYCYSIHCAASNPLPIYGAGWNNVMKCYAFNNHNCPSRRRLLKDDGNWHLQAEASS